MLPRVLVPTPELPGNHQSMASTTPRRSVLPLRSRTPLWHLAFPSEPHWEEAFTGRRRGLLQRKLGRVAAGPPVPPQISGVLNRKGHQVRGKKWKWRLKGAQEVWQHCRHIFNHHKNNIWHCNGWRSASSQQFGHKPLVQCVFLCFHDYLCLLTSKALKPCEIIQTSSIFYII